MYLILVVVLFSNNLVFYLLFMLYIYLNQTINIMFLFFI